MLALTRNSDFYGIIGMESSVKVDGVTVCIGDVVKVEEGDNNQESKSVVGIFDAQRISVMGLGRTPLSELTVSEIISSHAILKDGDALHHNYFKVQRFNS